MSQQLILDLFSQLLHIIRLQVVQLFCLNCLSIRMIVFGTVFFVFLESFSGIRDVVGKKIWMLLCFHVTVAGGNQKKYSTRNNSFLKIREIFFFLSILSFKQ